MALAEKARGQRIAQLRKRKRLTQQAMAERLQIAYRTYQTWEAGTMPEWDNLEKLASFFGVKPEFLIGDNGIADDPDLLPQLDRIETKLEAVLIAVTQLGERVAEAELRQAGPDAEALAQSEAATRATAPPRPKRQR
jgi:transcriptional regulator with XRE-family HTH domain